MYTFYNPNPQGKSVGDCTVRALSRLLDISWSNAYEMLCQQGAMDSDMPDSNAVMCNLMKRLGFRKEVVPDECPDCYTLVDFVEDHPYGRFLVAFGTHVVCVADGRYFDSWDSGGEVPIYYFKEEY